jgi:hypothetical protein
VPGIWGIGFHMGLRRRGEPGRPPLHKQSEASNMPEYIQPLVSAWGFHSAYLVDTRDATHHFKGRVLDPWNHIFPEVALKNRLNGSQRNGPDESSTGLSNGQGFYVQWNLGKCADVYSIKTNLSLGLEEMTTGATWGGDIRMLLASENFEPMEVPAMSLRTGTTVDLKIRYNKVFLVHLVLKAYQGDKNMSEEVYRIDEDLLEALNAESHWTTQSGISHSLSTKA